MGLCWKVGKGGTVAFRRVSRWIGGLGGLSCRSCVWVDEVCWWGGRVGLAGDGCVWLGKDAVYMSRVVPDMMKRSPTRCSNLTGLLFNLWELF